jgi:DNA-damage-inducible protein J
MGSYRAREWAVPPHELWPQIDALEAAIGQQDVEVALGVPESRSGVVEAQPAAPLRPVAWATPPNALNAIRGSFALLLKPSNMEVSEVLAMTSAPVDLSYVDHDVRAEVLQRLSASGLSEQVFVSHFYRLFAQGQLSLLDLLGPNAESRQAIQELEEGRGVACASADDLFADLHAND